MRLFTALSFSGFTAVGDTAEGGLTITWELFTVTPCEPKHSKRSRHRYLKTFEYQTETESFFKIEETILN